MRAPGEEPTDGYEVGNTILYEPAGTPEFNYKLRIHIAGRQIQLRIMS
jgi:hypothetical protein